MIRPLAFHEDVRDEVDDAYLWYERQRGALGEEFLAEVQDTLDQIAGSPELAPTIYRDIRVRFVRRFPYGVYYRVEAARVFIVAIQHGKRSPRRWRSRI
jgi:plasmid stabilization system protein ParE